MEIQEFSFKLFIKIQNLDHQSCIQILLNTGFGFLKFRKLLHILINNFPNDFNLDEYTITLNKDKDYSLKVFIKQQEIDELIINEKENHNKQQQGESKQHQSQKELNQDALKLELLKHKNFFKYLFLESALNNLYIYQKYNSDFAEGKNPSFEVWKQIFQTFWFGNKVIRLKVVHLQIVNDNHPSVNVMVYKKRQYETLILLPNTDIILTTTNSKQNLVLGYTNKIFYNQQQQYGLAHEYGIYPNLTQQGIFMHNCCYIGQLDPFSFLPSGKGCYHKLPPEPVFNIYPQRFELGLPQDNFKINRIHQSQIVQTEGKFIEGLIDDGRRQEKLISFSENASVYYRFLKGLLPGKWLLQTILDYLASEIIDYIQVIQQINQNEIENEDERQIFLVDTRETQDIFSSQIGRTEGFNLDFWIHSYQKYNKIKECFEKNKLIRIIFLIITDQSHFICAAYENYKTKEGETTNQIYVLNSLSTSFDQKILETIEIFFSNQNIFPKQQQQNTIKLSMMQNLPQQKNGYDCSMHTLYNFIKMMENRSLAIEEIDFSVSSQEISELRLLVLQHFMQTNNWAIILSKLKQFKQGLKNTDFIMQN